MELDGVSGVSFETSLEIDQVLQTGRIDVRNARKVENDGSEDRPFVFEDFGIG